MMAEEMNELDKPLSPFLIAIIPFYTAFFIGLFLFPIAQDWGWLQAWLVVVAFSLILGVGYYRINKENPRVLRNRMKLKKKGLTEATKKSAGSDRFIMPIMSAGFFAALLLPSLGRRFGWPELPLWLSLIGLLISCAGTTLVLISMYQNAHASKILDINQEQQLIDTGLYGKVRHPLYAGAVWMILGLPVALGSYWGLIPALISCFSLVWRIEFEEDMLLKGMHGYAAYREQVRYKLFPGIY
jgi:protein-S-isoprenylcysteine O-methyltransferase Ste14